MTPARSGASAEITTADIDEARSGSVPAFEHIYRSLAGAVASYLRWNGTGDVESVTNEVMAQVHRNLGRFTGDASSFRSWVFTIAHHRMVDDRRSRGRRPVIADAEIQDGAAIGDAEQDAFDLLGDERLRALLARLSPDQRDVLLLRIVADLSLEDSAAALGKQRGAIKSLQHRALATLRRQLESEGHEP